MVKKPKDLDTLFNDNEQIKTVLNNNWMADGTVNPFFGKALPEEKKDAKKDRKPNKRQKRR